MATPRRDTDVETFCGHDLDEIVDEERGGQLCGGRSARTMRHWRSIGIGPVYIRIGGGIGYRVRDLRDWQDENRVEPTGRAA